MEDLSDTKFKGQTTGEGALPGHTDWTRHAPPGGVSINGKHYGGGRFIPAEELEQASPDEIAELNRKSELSRNYLETPMGSPEGAPPGLEEISPEMLYIVDDGKILGGTFGEFVIKKNVTADIFLDQKEVAMLNSFNAKRLDIVCPDRDEVLSIYNSGLWPVENTLESLSNNTKKTSIAEYTLLNNLSPKVKDLLLAKTMPIIPVAPSEPQTPFSKGGSAEGASDAGPQELMEKPEKPVNTQMSLIRLSKISKNNWSVEKPDGSVATLRVATDIEKRKIKFVYHLYKALEIPVELLEEVEEGFIKDGIKEDGGTEGAPEGAPEGELKSEPEDNLFDVIDKQILNQIKGVKSTGEQEKDRIPKTQECETLCPKLENITPDLIDNLMRQYSITKAEALEIKNKVLQSLDEEQNNKIKESIRTRNGKNK